MTGYAVVLPGANYTADSPLLYWARAMLEQQGWRVQPVAWTLDDAALAHPHSFVERTVADAFAAAPEGTRRLIVAKSFGCFALPWALHHGVPGVWLTPVLGDDAVADALRGATVEDLAVGGSEDGHWLPDRVAGTRARTVTVPGAGHALSLEGDWRGSLALQAELLGVVGGHVAALGASSS